MFASGELARMCRACVELAAEMRGISPPSSRSGGSGIQLFDSEDQARIFLSALGVANEAAATFNDRLQELAQRMGLGQPTQSVVAAIVGPSASAPREKRNCLFCRERGTHPPMVTGGLKGEHAICEGCIQQAQRLLSEQPP